MKRTLINMILIPLLTLLPAITFAAPAYAACGNSSAAQQVSTGIDETTNASCDASGVNKAISVAVNCCSRRGCHYLAHLERLQVCNIGR
jgi:hypothetical protein